MTKVFDHAPRRICTMKIQSVLAIVLICCGGFGQAFALPRIITQPSDQSVSLGAIVTNLVSASTSAPPLSYQWHFNGAEIAGATKRTLILTNVLAGNAGGYSVVMIDSSGSLTSRVAILDVDPTFTMITTGPIVTDNGLSVGVLWGDYNNDGFPDLFIGNAAGMVNFLYRNKGDGTFEPVFPIGLGGGEWADYDNDGWLDLYTVTARNLGGSLFHNQGNGTLLRLTNAAAVGPIISDRSASGSITWGDYDGDGFVDAFVANGAFSGDLKNFLYHNEGNGTFVKVTTGPIVNDLYESWTGAWADYDDDGRLDLFVTSNGGFTPSGLGEDNQWYHNDGSAGFTKRTAVQLGLPSHDGGYSRGCTWGDYDNDGWLDLFVSGRTNLLYHNKGDGTFTKIITGEIVTDATISESIGCSWVDYDNDGYLDLFVVNVADHNFFYHNNGNGTFTKIITGSLVNDGAINSVGAAWADFDNDGFMDVVIANEAANGLFHNNGNRNHWINLKLVGTASNRAAIGAKVRLLATVGGKSVWQRRDVAGRGQSELRASFGLGDATNIDTVRIEWPSGTVQELHDIGANQFLTITELARLKGNVNGGQYQLVLNGGIGFNYEVQASADLVDWTLVTNIATTNMTMPVLSVDVSQAQRKYFRAMRK
jgi:hypothetical protein